MIKAVLFDMDGTLLDTEKYLIKFWRQAAEEAGLNRTEQDFYPFRSLGTRYAAQLFKETFGENFDYYQIRERRKELMKRHLDEQGLELKPDVIETLKALKEKGYQIAVVTATDETRAKQYLTELQIYEWFDSVVCATMVERGKPFPDVYLYACEKIRRKPEECMAVEDAPNGVRSAYAAGCHTVMVPDLTGPDEELRTKTIGIARTIKDILEYLPGK